MAQFTSIFHEEVIAIDEALFKDKKKVVNRTKDGVRDDRRNSDNPRDKAADENDKRRHSEDYKKSMTRIHKGHAETSREIMDRDKKFKNESFLSDIDLD